MFCFNFFKKKYNSKLIGSQNVYWCLYSQLSTKTLGTSATLQQRFSPVRSAQIDNSQSYLWVILCSIHTMFARSAEFSFGCIRPPIILCHAASLLQALLQTPSFCGVPLIILSSAKLPVFHMDYIQFLYAIQFPSFICICWLFSLYKKFQLIMRLCAVLM